MTIEERARIHEKREYDGIKEGIEFFKTLSLFTNGYVFHANWQTKVI